MTYQNKVVLVTGGGAGIGREAKTLQASDMLALDENVPGGVDFGF